MPRLGPHPKTEAVHSKGSNSLSRKRKNNSSNFDEQLPKVKQILPKKSALRGRKRKYENDTQHLQEISRLYGRSTLENHN